jgi:hypothetical protein
MDWDGFLGGSYESQSLLADCERTVNWYPEKLQSENASRKKVLYPTPGVNVVTQVASGYGRAHFCMQGREFAVVGAVLWEIDVHRVATNRGTMAMDANPATICSNGDFGSQLFITSGGNGYLYDLTLDTLTQIPALNGLATMGGFLDGYFLAFDGNTSTVYISDLNDHTLWETGLQKVQRSAQPDRWLSMKVVGRWVWLFGERTTEIWNDQGGLVPLGLYQGAPIIQYGIAAPFSTAIIGDYIMWLAQTATGRICVCLGAGVTANVISTYALDTALYNYRSRSEAIGDAYADRGHTFYMIGFDKDHVTWCFDLETKLWHERGTWNSDEDRYDSWRPRFYAFAFGEHRMLDVQSRNIFRMSADITTDADGSFIRRMRRSPAITSGNDRIFYSSLELLMEPGLGLLPPGDPPTACFTWTAEDT